MSAPVLPSPDPDPPVPHVPPAAPAHRSTELKAAWIGALAGGVVAAVISGVMTAVVTFSTVDRQVEAEDVRAELEFARTNTADAYVKFIAQSRRTIEVIYSIDQFNDRPGSPELDTRDEVAIDADLQLRLLDEAESAVLVFGSARARESVDSCMFTLHNAEGVAQVYRYDQENFELFEELLNYTAESRQCIDDFIVLANEELSQGS